MVEGRDRTARADWENEGGSVGVADRGLARPDHASFPPSLPSGHEAHSVWGFNDPTGRFSYEFSRVYKASDRIGSAGPICLLDEGLSYWSVTWMGSSDTGDHLRESRCVNFAQARKARRSRMTFQRFSSLYGMRDELPGLLRVDDVEPETAGPPGSR